MCLKTVTMKHCVEWEGGKFNNDQLVLNFGCPAVVEQSRVTEYCPARRRLNEEVFRQQGLDGEPTHDQILQIHGGYLAKQEIIHIQSDIGCDTCYPGLVKHKVAANRRKLVRIIQLVSKLAGSGQQPKDDDDDGSKPPISPSNVRNMHPSF